MRVMCVSSFHSSSTRDVWLKTMKGLRANGIDVVPFDVMPRYQLFAFMEQRFNKIKNKPELPVDWTPTTLAYEVILGAAVYHNVEWVLVVSPQYMPEELPHMMRSMGIKMAAYFTECPYEDTIHTPVTASAFDVALLSDKYSVGLFESFCPTVAYVPHCYDPDLHYPGGEREENTVFVGTGYNTRAAFMRKVKWPSRLDLYGYWPAGWVGAHTNLRQFVRSKTPTTPQETADIYRASLTAFSLHREMRYMGSEEAILPGEAYSLGPRNWELAACRTFQVSDYRPELEDVFGDAIPQFETPEELSALLKRAFDEPSWREELADRQCELVQPYSCNAVMKAAADALAA